MSGTYARILKSEGLSAIGKMVDNNCLTETVPTREAGCQRVGPGAIL